MAYICDNCQGSTEKIYVDVKTGDFLCPDCYFDDEENEEDLPED